jgi:integrase
LEKAGLPKVPFHSLRHSFASIQLMSGTNPKVVQEALGHSSITLTLDTYSHVIPTIQKEAADKMDEVFK